MEDASTATALWWAVVASGVYHGINPGMGWPLAVSAALMERGAGALYKALLALAAGHLLAMAMVLFPFSVMVTLVEWQRELRIGAAVLVIGLGVYLLINRRHPRFLARVPPSRLMLWSFLAAMAHGAGLMLVPIYLGLCDAAAQEAGHVAAARLMGSDALRAGLVALAHTLAMAASGGAIAVGVYYWLGLAFLKKSWFNLDVVWALSLIVVGAVALFASH
ncbi:hypothetical protein SAMN05443432_101169 [Roseovarius litoreus]|uniref:Uncharacterized protein n=1 Tax=Roseovarius litoreus TaxID=1155722 RepID=A0A1M6ZSD3_9RHOB|nr:hypothetical protein [Roseovarius litoreus]SHL33346.1 hypothetical protein SAMN05443432_101169 [Roseovarius litoreus]